MLSARLWRFIPSLTLIAAVALFGAALLVSACDAHIGDSVYVSNKTDQALTISVYGDGGVLYKLRTVDAAASRLLMGAGELSGDSTVTKGGCTFGDLVAVNAQGREIARRQAPLCTGDTWVIEAPGPSAT